jgi:hypothetical protein
VIAYFVTAVSQASKMFITLVPRANAIKMSRQIIVVILALPFLGLKYFVYYSHFRLNYAL